MGRYYSGDIEGRFWFAIQSSDDASFFGVEGSEPNYITYYFDKSNLETIKKGLSVCRKELGDNRKKLDKCFKGNNRYSYKALSEVLKTNDVRKILEWYARFKLGKKILACVEKKGECVFDAEL